MKDIKSLIEALKKRVVLLQNPYKIYLLGSSDQAKPCRFIIVLDDYSREYTESVLAGVQGVYPTVYTKDEFTLSMRNPFSECYTAYHTGMLLYTRQKRLEELARNAISSQKMNTTYEAHDSKSMYAPMLLHLPKIDIKEALFTSGG